MGYDTYFNGSFKFNKPVEKELTSYINKFSKTRRMKRDINLIKETFPNWKEQCFMGKLGIDGEYFVGGTGYCGQNADASVVNQNCPPLRQPGLWCQWIIRENENGYGITLEWDEGEKFYNYVEWLQYLISNFFEPLGYELSGEVTFQGEEDDDFGVITVADGIVEIEYGIHAYSLEEISDNDLLSEMEKRGYKVIA